MTAADRICSFLESKLPRSFWDFHGLSIRTFILVELATGEIDCIVPCSDDFAKESRVERAAMQEVIGESIEYKWNNPAADLPLYVNTVAAEYADGTWASCYLQGNWFRRGMGEKNGSDYKRCEEPVRWRELTDKEYQTMFWREAASWARASRLNSSATQSSTK